MSVADNIKNIIHLKGIKQYVVAQQAGYDLKTFNALLNKRRLIKSDDVFKICAALEITPNVLFGFEKYDPFKRYRLDSKNRPYKAQAAEEKLQS